MLVTILSSFCWSDGTVAGVGGGTLWELKAALQFLADWWLWVTFVTADTTRIFPGVVPRVRTFKHLATTVILQSFHFLKYYIAHKSSQIGPRCGFGNVMLRTQTRAFCFVFHRGKPLYVWDSHKSFRTNDLQAHLELSLYTYIPDTTLPLKQLQGEELCAYLHGNEHSPVTAKASLSGLGTKPICQCLR